MFNWFSSLWFFILLLFVLIFWVVKFGKCDINESGGKRGYYMVRKVILVWEWEVKCGYYLYKVICISRGCSEMVCKL